MWEQEQSKWVWELRVTGLFIQKEGEKKGCPRGHLS